MWKRSRTWIAMFVVILVAVSGGCQKTPPAEKKAKPAAPKVDANKEKADAEPATKRPDTTKPAEKSSENETASAKPEVIKPEPLPPAKIPPVRLSEADLKTTLLKVGDTLPAGELPDLSGKAQAIQSLLGPKATVVVFWASEGISNLQELQDLTSDVAEPFAQQGVRVVAINVEGAPEEVKARAELAGARFPVLLDRDKAYFAKVAAEKLPRTYLVDSQGKVLWFDLGYSPETRRDLLESLRAIMAEAPK